MRRRGYQPQRLTRAVARHLRRHADATHPDAALRQLLPGGHDSSLPVRGPRLCVRSSVRDRACLILDLREPLPVGRHWQFDTDRNIQI